MLKFIDDIALKISRPKRFHYSAQQLGPTALYCNGRAIQRHDFTVLNTERLTLQCSLYCECAFQDVSELVVYLHCNSGCRLEGLDLLPLAVHHQVALLVFDFAGSGLSEGRYITLGLREAMDIRCVLKHVKDSTQVRLKVCLWGRSMGAVAALRHVADSRDIAIVVLDSPFASLHRLFSDIAGKFTSIPIILLRPLISRLQDRLSQKGLNSAELDNLPKAKQANVDAVFIACKEDSVIPFKHIEQLYDNYRTENKKIYFINSDHCEGRDQLLLEDVWRDVKAKFYQLDLTPIKYEKYSDQEVVLEADEKTWNCSLFTQQKFCA